VAKLKCFVIGTNDLVKDSRMKATHNRMALLPSLSLVVMAARAFNISCVDGVYNDITDEAGYTAECGQGMLLGMDGKSLVHPSQIEIANRIFSPSPEEVAWAKAVINVFAQTENTSKAVATLNGKMVERLHLTMAEHIMATHEANT
jgi:citrate lyase subunit beta / citryl-CoA lyase